MSGIGIDTFLRNVEAETNVDYIKHLFQPLNMYTKDYIVLKAHHWNKSSNIIDFLNEINSFFAFKDSGLIDRDIVIYYILDLIMTNYKAVLQSYENIYVVDKP